jgi:hypothetical protein
MTATIRRTPHRTAWIASLVGALGASVAATLALLNLGWTAANCVAYSNAYDPTSFTGTAGTLLTRWFHWGFIQGAIPPEPAATGGILLYPNTITCTPVITSGQTVIVLVLLLALAVGLGLITRKLWRGPTDISPQPESG